jgi:hypothetical protein
VPPPESRDLRRIRRSSVLTAANQRREQASREMREIARMLERA